MRVAIIVSILMFVTINNIEAKKRFPLREYINAVSKDIDNVCNHRAYIKTNNEVLYNCFNVNNTDNCKHLDNFTQYNDVKMLCTDDNKSTISSYMCVLMLLLLWILLRLD